MSTEEEKLLERKKRYEAEGIPTILIDKQLEELKKKQLESVSVKKPKKVKKSKKAKKSKKVKKSVGKIEHQLRILKECCKSEFDLLTQMRIFLNNSPNKLDVKDKISSIENQDYRDIYWETFFTDVKLVQKELQDYLIDKFLKASGNYFDPSTDYESIFKEILEALRNDQYEYFNEFKLDVYKAFGIKPINGYLKAEHFSKPLGLLQKLIIDKDGNKNRLINVIVNRVWSEIICFNPFFYFDAEYHSFYDRSRELLNTIYENQMKTYFPFLPINDDTIPKKFKDAFPKRFYYHFRMPYLNNLNSGYNWEYDWYIKLNTGKGMKTKGDRGLYVSDQDDRYQFNFVDGVASRGSYRDSSTATINIHPLELYLALAKIPFKDGNFDEKLPAQTFFHELHHQLQYRAILFEGFYNYLLSLQNLNPTDLTVEERNDYLEMESLTGDFRENLRLALEFKEDYWGHTNINPLFTLLLIKDGRKNPNTGFESLDIDESVNKTLFNFEAHNVNFANRVKDFKDRDEAMKQRKVFFSDWVLPMYYKYIGKQNTIDGLKAKGLWTANDEFYLGGYIL